MDMYQIDNSIIDDLKEKKRKAEEELKDAKLKGEPFLQEKLSETVKLYDEILEEMFELVKKSRQN